MKVIPKTPDLTSAKTDDRAIEENKKEFIMTYSDYSNSGSGFARQMKGLLPYLRRNFNVIEVGIGATSQQALIESHKTKNIIIPTTDNQGNSINGEYYANTILKTTLQDCINQGIGLPKLVFINHDLQCFDQIGRIFYEFRIPMVYWAIIDNDYISYNILNYMSVPDHLIFQTNYARKVVTEVSPFLDGPVIYPSIETDWLEPCKPEKIFSEFDFAKHIGRKKIVLFVGKNQARKNIAVLIDAVSIIRERGNDDIMFIIHAPRTKEEFQGVDYARLNAETFDFEEYVWKKRFGRDNFAWNDRHVNDVCVNAFYEMADLLVVPSCSEGFGMIFLEGMKKGLPCISTNYSATGEILGDGRGILIDPIMKIFHNDRRVLWAYISAEELADKILYALSSKFDKTNMITKGKEFINKYNIAAQSNKIINELDKIITHYEAYKNPMPIQVLL